MPENHVQPDPKETVEAQLCAYLEGDLSPAERMAIEQHLAVNPQHQRLLADLAENRGWLRDLPREPAPADVGEAFQQQVERSLLLGDGGPTRRPGGRMPQVLMIAALVLLTAGLGVGLMLMLSNPDRRPKLAADVPTTEHSGAAATEPALLTDVSPAPAAAPQMPAPVAPGSAPAVMSADAPLAKAVTPAMPDAAALGAASPLHLRVETSDPAAVNSILTKDGMTTDGSAPMEPMASRAGGGNQFGTQRLQSPSVRQFAQMDTARKASNSNAPAVTTEPTARRYVAHGLTRDQANRLTADLARTSAHVTVDSPVTRPTARLAVGELVTVVIPQLTGPGVTEANTVRVAADGTITLPMLDAVPAVGLTDDALSRRIADRYRSAHLIADPTVTVVTSVTPTTRSAELRTVTVDVEPKPAK
jgi:anti-sigma factor RsiW